jgi:hypothetical protein
MPTIEEKKVLAQKQFAFRLRSGSHHDQSTGQTIEAGKIFYTNDNMQKLHGRQRWELVQETGQDSIEELKAKIRILEGRVAAEIPQTRAGEDPDDLDGKSIKELKAMAADMEPSVDLSTCTGKTEIVNAIRAALDAA